MKPGTSLAWNEHELFLYGEDSSQRHRVCNLPEEYLFLRDVLGLVLAHFTGGNQPPCDSALAYELFTGEEMSAARYPAGVIRLVEKALGREPRTEEVEP